MSQKDIQQARKASYVGFLSRHPFSTDAYRRGFATGVREDYTLQDHDLPNVDVPVTILDNHYEDPDIERYLEAFDQYDPSVAILGDAYNQEEAQELNELAEKLLEEHPYKELIIVPKCKAAFNELGDNITLGYPMGYSDLEPQDYSQLSDWRGRKIHLLGASPPKQLDAIDKLTQPRVTGEPPSNIVGLDWNGVHKVAYMGQSWSTTGWKDADHLSIRETVQHSLDEIKKFWQHHEIWPDTTPRDLHGPPTTEPDQLIHMDRGGDPISNLEDLEKSYVEEYQRGEETVTWAFDSELQKKRFEYHEGLL